MCADSLNKVNNTGAYRQRIDQILDILWVVLGLIFVIQSWDLEHMDEYGPGPGFLPFWLGVGFMFVGFLQFLLATFTRKEKEDILLPSKLAARQMFLVMVAFFGLVFLGEMIGFIICIGLLFFFILTIVEKKGWKFSLTIAIINSLWFWVVFELAFELWLPPGLLELLR